MLPTSAISAQPSLASREAPSRQASFRRGTRSLLTHWHLLSLDAPTVATVWTLYIASAAHLHLPLRLPVAMFSSVWLLYAVDRLLDSRILATPQARAHPGKPSSSRLLNLPYGLEERHFFHHRHRRPIVAGIAACALLLAALIPKLDPIAIHLDLLLGSLLIAYFLLIHAHSNAHRLPKEIAVGLFFSAAVFIPSVARASHLEPSMLPIAFLFAGLCSLNCFFIYHWEHVVNSVAPKPPNINTVTRTVIGHLRGLTVTLVALSLLLAAVTHQITSLPVALSALLLLGLDRLRPRLSPVTLRAAADLVLLTPLPLLLFHIAAG